MAMALLIIYLLVSLLTDPTGYLTTDVGGKTASLELMVERGDWDPDIGYWFEHADPDGDFYPFAHTVRTPNGQWVNTTSLTMIYLMRPLWALGGAHLALLIPIAGAVITALAAAALERRLNPTRTGTWGFWIIGLATPTFVYALDLWEHTLGLAGMAIGTVAVHDVINNRNPNSAAIIAGLGYGFAATMRQEALVYGLVAGILLTVSTARRQSPKTTITRSTLMATATLSMLAAHTIAEYTLLGGPLRFQRSGSTIAGGGTFSLDRLQAIAATLLFPFNGDHILSYVFGAALLVGSTLLTLDLLRGKDRFLPRLLVMVAVIFCALFYLAFGGRFVPGLVPTTPLAGVGLAAAIHSRHTFVYATALLPLPLLFVAQYPDGAIPQWGGRYLLLTGFILAVAAIAFVADNHRQVVIGFAACGLAITLFGVLWTIERKDRVTDDWETLELVNGDDDVVIWRDFFVAREAGPVMIGHRWLSAPYEETRAEIADVLVENDIDTFLWIEGVDRDISTFTRFRPVDELGTLDFFQKRIIRFVRN